VKDKKEDFIKIKRGKISNREKIKTKKREMVKRKQKTERMNIFFLQF
jgi:hypothetical protein